jgi:uncharacterized membrane protein
MSDRLLRAAIVAPSIAGAAVSGYLVAVRYTGTELVCATGGCATVQSSPYAEVLGAPVALLGLVAYLLIGASALSSTPFARAAGATLALSALAFSTYLLAIQLTVVDAVCDWCLVSDVLTTLLAGASVLRLGVVRPAAAT